MPRIALLSIFLLFGFFVRGAHAAKEEEQIVSVNAGPSGTFFIVTKYRDSTTGGERLEFALYSNSAKANTFIAIADPRLGQSEVRLNLYRDDQVTGDVVTWRKDGSFVVWGRTGGNDTWNPVTDAAVAGAQLTAAGFKGRAIEVFQETMAARARGFAGRCPSVYSTLAAIRNGN